MGIEHEYTLYSVTEPTCTENGVKVYECIYGDTYTEIIPALGHTPSETVEENRTEPTCTEDSFYDAVVYCTVCQEEFSRETTVISAPGHRYSAWEVTTEPTMTADGVKTKTCSACGTEETDKVPKTGIIVTITDSSGKVVEEKIIEGDLTNVSFAGLTDSEYAVIVSKETYATRIYTVSATDGEASLDFSLNKTGDMNGDGKVNAVDVARANAHAKGVSSLSGYALDCVDVNGDGKVNAIDVALLNAHSKGVKSLW